MRVILIPMVLAAAAFAGDAIPRTAIDDGYRQMYNLDFDGAHRSFAQWESQHPEDPLGPISNAASYLFAEFDRLRILQAQFFTDDESFLGRNKPTADPVVKQRFEADLAKGQQLADRILSRSPEGPEAKAATFASVLRLGLHADYLSLIEKKNLQALSEMKGGRAMAEKLLSEDPSYYDAYLAVGVENYMLSLKPAPARWLLRLGGAQTDKESGIEKLRLTARNGHFLKPFARLLLAVAALRDNRHPEAKELLAGLAREFPRNQLYSQELAKIK